MLLSVWRGSASHTGRFKETIASGSLSFVGACASDVHWNSAWIEVELEWELELRCKISLECGILSEALEARCTSNAAFRIRWKRMGYWFVPHGFREDSLRITYMDSDLFPSRIYIDAGAPRKSLACLTNTFEYVGKDHFYLHHFEHRSIAIRSWCFERCTGSHRRCVARGWFEKPDAFRKVTLCWLSLADPLDNDLASNHTWHVSLPHFLLWTYVETRVYSSCGSFSYGRYGITVFEDSKFNWRYVLNVSQPPSNRVNVYRNGAPEKQAARDHRSLWPAANKSPSLLGSAGCDSWRMSCAKGSSSSCCFLRIDFGWDNSLSANEKVLKFSK